MSPAKKVVKQVAKKAVKKAAPTKPAAGADWRPAKLDQLRKLIFAAVPAMTEEVKWRKPSNPAGVAAWSHGGLVATGEMYKGVVKLTFFQGASLPDPKKLFNAGFGGGTRRAIDLREGESVDPAAFKALVKAAAALAAGKKS